jgi:formiminoglutamate deiminase
MYEVAVSLDPLVYEDVAAAVFAEMALAGITTVGEFHYLHHRIGGVPYRDSNEMGHAVIRAARRAGIRIGLLDAGYLTAGFDRSTLHPVQERFSDKTTSAWLERVDELMETYQDQDDVRIGVAPHSVRAVPLAGLEQLAGWSTPTTRIQIHVSEQPAENLACVAAHGITPVGLLDQVGLLGPNTTIVHGTHLTDTDITSLGSTRTGVCICPTTERDLADGIGPTRALRNAGSPLTVGSDSQAVIDLFEEARGIELHHRLAAGRRGGFAPATLLEAATVNGASALGFEPPRLAAGAPADFVRLDHRSPRLAGLPARAESVVFAATGADVRDVFVGGRRIVAKGKHPEWKTARKTFKSRR